MCSYGPKTCYEFEYLCILYSLYLCNTNYLRVSFWSFAYKFFFLENFSDIQILKFSHSLANLFSFLECRIEIKFYTATTKINIHIVNVTMLLIYSQTLFVRHWKWLFVVRKQIDDKQNWQKCLLLKQNRGIFPIFLDLLFDNYLSSIKIT